MRDYLYNLATDKYNSFIANLIKALLLAVSFIYGLVVRIIILIYRLKPYRLNCKVVSIGNITLGGTGKTSLVEYIVRYLQQQGHKVAIVTRGYKKLRTKYQVPSTGYTTMGDEPYMLQQNLKNIPIIVDANRIRGAKLAMRKHGIDTVILDDGFQQWKLRKDLDIVTIDATDPFGNCRLIPRGILREPLSSFRRADIFVLTKTNLNPDITDIKSFLNSINPRAPVIESIHQPTGFYRTGKANELLELDILKAKTVSLVSAIGDPDSFENLIRSLGIDIGLVFVFTDHHPYSRKDLKDIIKESQKKNIDTIVTTEKDAVRLSQLSTVNCQLTAFVLRIEIKITKNEQEFHNRLLKLYSL